MANPKQLNQMARQMQKVQADMVAAQEALAAEVVSGSAGGGMVTAEVTGAGELRSVRIAAEVVDPDDVEMLEDLVVAAVGEALRRAQARQQERLGGLAGGMDLGALGRG